MENDNDENTETKNTFSLKALFFNLRRQRLEAEISNYLEELGNYCQEEESSWLKISQQLLKEATEALSNYKFELAWRKLHAAKRQEVFGITDGREFYMEAIQLREEASKIKAWRRKIVEECVAVVMDHPEIKELNGQSAENDQNEDPNYEAVQRVLYRGRELIDEHYENIYYKIRVRKRNLWIIFSILLATLIVACILLSMYQSEWSLQQLIIIVILGAMGASFSVAYTFTSSALKDKIPDQALGAVVTWMRPLIGGSAALMLFIFVEAGLKDLIKVPDSEGFGIFAVAFIAGFSERLVLNVFERWGSE